MQDANFDGVSGYARNAIAAARLNRRNVFFRRDSFFISILSSVGSVRFLVIVLRSVLVGRHAVTVAAMLTSAFEHRMCHTKNFQRPIVYSKDSAMKLSRSDF